MRIVSMLICLILVGCAKGGDTPAATNKSLWSRWTRTDNSFYLDLTGGSLGTNLSYNVVFANGAICSCNLQATGTEASGNYTLSGCAYVSGGSGNPGCASLNETGTFTKSASALQICSSSCRDYN